MNCKNKSFMTKKKAFTLIELLIVIAIIGILFIVLVSKVDFATDKAKATGVQTDFRSFQMAFDTVAKENAGFNTFGWDTGDANQDGIRNSYDEGDTNKDGIQNGTEVFTGHKVYAETFTKVYSLKKNGTGSYDRDALNRLETAINANLDPKLHITIKDDGEIVMANGAKDPWNKEYHGWYITNAEVDKQDRGAIVMYSDGANNEFGSEHSISNGIVKVIVPGNNKAGKDDYSIVSLYTFVNGYGEIKNITTGFSNNQTLLGGNASNVEIDTPGEGNNLTYTMITGADQSIAVNASSAEFASDADFSKFVKVVVDTTDLVENEHYTVHSGSTVVTLKPTFIATLNVGEHTMYIYSEDGIATCKFYIEEPASVELAEGLYDENDEMLVSIDVLKSEYGWDPIGTSSYTNSKHITTIVNTHFPTAKKIIVDKIENPVIYLFRRSTLETVILRDVNKTRGLFWEFKGKYVEIGGNIDTLQEEALRDCPNLIEAKIPDTVVIYKQYAVANVPKLTKLNISEHIRILEQYSLDVEAITEFPTHLYDIESIGYGALGYNMNIDVVFGDKLTNIADMNFYAHKDDATCILTFTTTTPPTASSHTFWRGDPVVGTLIIKVPAESLEAYKAAVGFSRVADHIIAIED